jgi:hypothetical protein
MSEFPTQIANIITNAQIVAPQYVLFDKVMNGDASDDISPIMSRVVNGRTYKLTRKQLDEISGSFANRNSCGFFTEENLYNKDDIMHMLAMAHMRVHKVEFSELTEEWQKFYYDKFVENRQMVCINQRELGGIYDTVLQSALEQLHGLKPVIAFPTWQVLQTFSI